MAIRNLRMYGDKLLGKVSKPVDKFDGKLNDLLDDMWDTLEKHNGMGLAAPQVGVLKRIAIVNIINDNDDEVSDTAEDDAVEYGAYELINPVIIETEGEEEQNEGCLSLPGKNAPVKRPARVKVRALDREGDVYELEGTGLVARALCHEIDHLDGIMYVDKIDPSTLKDNDESDD